MKTLILGFSLFAIASFAGCSKSGPQKAVAGCATCIFDMEGVTGCKLAVKIDGAPYLVTGSDIDDHGDAHGSDGLCNSARDALIEGTIKDGKFAAKKIEVLPK